MKSNIFRVIFIALVGLSVSGCSKVTKYDSGEIKPSAVFFEKEAETKVIWAKNMPFSISQNPDNSLKGCEWVTISIFQKQNDEKDVYISVKENDTGQTRVCILEMQDLTGKWHVITITQNG